MPDFHHEEPEEDRLVQEAEELMRQRRYLDAASRYLDLRRQSPTDLWTNLGYVSALECAGKVAEAESVLEEATSGHRRSAALHRFRHLFFERREDLHRAALSQQALHLEVVEDGTGDQLADLYFNQGRYHEASAELVRLLRETEFDQPEQRAGVLARIGACLRQSGDFDAARERLIEALALEPGNHWTLSELAEVERALGNVEASRRRYREALEADPKDHWTRGHLAQLEFEDGHLGASVALYEEIIAAVPKATWAKVELAQVLSESDVPRAAKLCESALDDDATYPWAHAQLGNLARRAGRMEEARQRYQTAAASSPNATWILHEQADICRHLGRMQEAYAHLEHAKGLDPYDAVTFGYFADLLRHEGKPVQAIAHLEKAVELDEDYAWAWRELAELRALAGEHAAAETAYHHASDLEPDEAINDGLKAFLLRCQNRRDAARPYLERAVERQGDYLWAWRELIDFHFSVNRADLAEDAARRALKALPDSTPIMGMLAEALRRLGRRTEASAVVDQALAHGDQAHLFAIRAEIAVEDEDLPAALVAARRAAELDASPEFQALLAQVFIASDRLDEAEALVTKLTKATIPIQPAFELAATLAERRQRSALALDWCQRALAGPYPGDARLILRRARLTVQAAKSPEETAAAIAPLAALFTRDSQPWREMAQVYAQAGRPVLARRAAHLHLAAATNAGERAKAWLALAELELSLGHPAEAGQALEQSLAIEADDVPARILGAVLADQRGDLPAAIAHLERIDELLVADRAPDAEPPAHEIALRRQLALLYERHGKLDQSERVWHRLCAETPTKPLVKAGFASFRLRQHRPDEALALTAEVLPALADDNASQATEAQQLLRDLAIHHAQREGGRAGAKAGRDLLLVHDAHLAGANRLLLVQLALAAEDLDLAERQLDLAEAGAPDQPMARLLRVRLLIARRDLDGAEQLVRTLREREPSDQEAASLLAECLAQRGRYAEALATLDDPGLPATPNLERGLLAALLALELHGENHCLSRLGRLAPPAEQPPLVRALAAAWPGAWATPDPKQPVQTGDVLSLPPFPAATRRLGAALMRADQPALAGLLITSVAAVLASQDDTAGARRLLTRAVVPLIRSGQRLTAWQVAWRSASVTALLRCLLP